ncbi:MAG: hypothetical protein PHS37_05440 [Candidatus Omnitrophica bacterium]|nr:hypothetical protein [Candidatus Omnitrophota bacterium]
MRNRLAILIFSLCIGTAIISLPKTVFAGKLYIKPDLEIKRAERLLDEAETEFRNGKVHITLSPDIAEPEFVLSKQKYQQAIELIERYGAGQYTPGDVDDFRKRMGECDLWIQKAKDQLKAQIPPQTESTK